ncbi:hypothetical protein [Dictyobacter kobayashii]|uniref:Secreted protein n=1 Tax=Dictyobacter kobayashii TaxID=2014872 RepID=A0A402AYS9_9CHLR|nr:hypothetical protein [Dictyobacter kobayashii]GCE24235.1 hypothetical protein KDK_80350 [Dictyobacter kobayashii]
MFIRCLVLFLMAACLLLVTGIVSAPSTYAAVATHATGPYGPDTCLTGYVWREAFTGDHVCVTPQRRTQVAFDNSQAYYRTNPYGGPYGKDTCRNGYVWREAGPDDHVCVTPDERTLVAQENQQAPYRYQS